MKEKKSTKLWQPKNVLDIIFTNAERYENKKALIYKEDHCYHELTYGELCREIVRASLALKKNGIKKNDRVLIISENRPEWVIVDVALMLVGAISVPVHKNMTCSQIECIMEETRPNVAFVSNEDTLKIIKNYVTRIDKIISFENIKSENNKIFCFHQLLDDFSVTSGDIKSAKKSAQQINPDIVVTIVYTSGTTGKPKGAQLTHRGFVYNSVYPAKVLHANAKDIFLSVLPLSHIFERASCYFSLYSGGTIIYCLDITQIAEYMNKYKPTIVIGVPRLFEKMYERILEQVDRNALLKTIFKMAMRCETDIILNLFDRLIFSKIRQKFGGRIRGFVSGGAALNENIAKSFCKIGIPILSGYGMTETTAGFALNRFEKNKIGTSGCALNTDIQIKIEDSEILVKAPSCMIGFVNENDNEGMFTNDGFLRTGDLGSLDEDGYVTVTGRKKDILVLATGEKVVPTVVEDAILSSPYINQVLVIGDGYKHISAIVVVDVERIKQCFGLQNKKEIFSSKKVRNLLSAELMRTTGDLPPIQRVKKYIIATEPFDTFNNQLTYTLKPRRREIINCYSEKIKKLYRVS